MINDKKLITVIIPCFNKENTIEKTLDSVLKQTIIDKIVILCIDDCSTDKTLEKLKEYKSKNKKFIKILHNKQNMSVFSSRVIGIETVETPFVGFIDPDDWVDETYFEDLLNGITINGSNGSEYYDVVYTKNVVQYYNEKKQINARDTILKYGNLGAQEFDLENKQLKKLLAKNWNLMWNKLFKTEIFKRLRFPKYYINFMEDIALVMLYYMNCKNINIIYGRSSYYYYLGDDVGHLSKLDSNKKADYVVEVFTIIDAYVFNHKINTEWLKIIRDYQRNYIISLSSAYKYLFNEGKNIIDENNDFLQFCEECFRKSKFN